MPRPGAAPLRSAQRRTWLRALALNLLAGTAAAAPANGGLHFPADHGAHPGSAIEWWYLTGHLRSGARRFGFQVTFFRRRMAAMQGMRSAFAAKQLLISHCALTDVAGRRLWSGQQVARTGFGVAEALAEDTALQLRRWRLQRGNAAAAPEGSRYALAVQTPDFALTLACSTRQPLLLQGEQGLSRKGPEPHQISRYYSQPQLQAEGTLTLHGQPLGVNGTAWLDHEWSEQPLPAQAQGWDWIGMNLLDGAALAAFRLRRPDGSALYAGGSLRPMGGPVRVAGPGDVVFSAQRHWVSPASGVRYPVQWRLQVWGETYTVRAVIDAQEIDSRASTGNLYWEGLSELWSPEGRLLGHGYLEMAGYGARLRW